MHKPFAIDLFAGAGGLSLGLIRAGFDLKLAVEFDDVATQTYKNNIGDHVLCADLHNLSGEEILRAAKLTRGKCDLLAGGPPCQGFSTQRRGSDIDVRNDLVLKYAEHILEIFPKIFVMENVAGLISKRGKPFLDAFVATTQEAGYATKILKVEAASFGVPQLRTRVIVIGQRLDLKLNEIELVPTIKTPDEYSTVREHIGDLPSPPTNGVSHPLYPNHSRETRISAINLERLKHIKPGGGREQLPDHLQLPCHKNNPSHRHMDVYGRLEWDKPSGTITARFDSFTRGRFGHPVEDRSLTLREGARLQTFPDDFIFVGNRGEGARQIGNAVPVLLAEAIGKAVQRSLLYSREIFGAEMLMAA